MGEGLIGEIFGTIDRFASTVPGFADRIAAGRPLRLALRRMLAGAYDMGNEAADDVITQWLQRHDRLPVADDENVPPVPPGLNSRLDELMTALQAADSSDLSSEAQMRMEAATILFDLGQLDDALSQAMVARGHFESLGQRTTVAEATMEIGLIQNAFGWHADAIGSYLAAKKILEVDDPNDFLGPLCLNLGNALKDTGRRREALIQYEVARRHYQRIDDLHGTAAATFNLANVGWSLGRDGKALEGFAAAREMYARLEMDHKIADCDLAAADVMFHAGDLSAIDLAMAALRRYDELELPVEVAKASMVVAHMADHLGDSDYARTLTQGALGFYQEAGMWPRVVEAATTLAYVESYAGNVEDALAALDLARTVSRDQELAWDEAYDRRMTQQIRTSTLPTHTHPEARDRSSDFVDERFLEALRLAVELHGGEPRKSRPGDPPGPPYIGHILGVAASVIDSGGSRDQAIAGLLHDAVEDSATTIGDIRVMFGEEVASIVDVCTDAPEVPKPPWRERKEAYVERLRSTGVVDAMLVTAADKLHNARSMIRDHAAIGDSLWGRFNAEADHGWYYRAVTAMVKDRLDNPIVPELETAVDALVEILPEEDGDGT